MTELIFCDHDGNVVEQDEATCVEMVWSDGRRSYMEKPQS